MIKIGTDFSGIGAPEQALKEMGIEHKVMFACEKDKYARQTYLANHSCGIMYEDVSTRDNDNAPYVDLYFSGFPCQTFSIAGKRKGFDDIRGTMFFHSADYIAKQRPKMFIMENVKGLLSHDKPKGSKAKIGRTFSTILNVLAKTVNGQILMPMYEDNLGYNIYWTVLNAKYYDVPQNRERVFIVGFRDDVTFNFPTSKIVTKRLSDILEPIVDEKYYLSDKMIAGLIKCDNDFKGRFIPKEKKEIGNCLTSRYYKMGRTDNYVAVKEATKQGYAVAGEGDSINMAVPNSKTRRGRVGVGVAQTLDTQCNQAVVSNQLMTTLDSRSDQKNVLVKIGQINGHEQDGRIYSDMAISPTLDLKLKDRPKIYNKQRIRRLTPFEAKRLMGFPDSFISPVSETQQYKQSGNSIVVTVLKAILKNMPL